MLYSLLHYIKKQFRKPKMRFNNMYSKWYKSEFPDFYVKEKVEVGKTTKFPSAISKHKHLSFSYEYSWLT